MLLLMRASGALSVLETPYGVVPHVQIAFGYDITQLNSVPLSNWVDVTEYVSEASTFRGRSSEFDEYQSGTAKIHLRNDQRQFDPLNSEGPFYGRLLPDVPIRIRGIEEDGTSHSIWVGAIDGWPATYAQGASNGEVQLNCTDLFKILAERPMPDYLEEVFFKTTGGATPHVPRPTAWFRMDGVNSGLISNAADSKRPAYAQAQLSAEDGLVPTSKSALKIPSSSPPTGVRYSGMSVPIPRDGEALWGGSRWTVAFTIQFENKGNFTTPGGYYYDLVTFSFNKVALAAIRVNSTGVPSVYVQQVGLTLIAEPTPATISALGYTIDIMDGKVHTVVASRDWDGSTTNTIRLSIDGVSVAEVSGNLGGRWLETNCIHHVGWTANSVTGAQEFPAFAIDELMTWATASHHASAATINEVLRVGFSEVRSSGDVVEDVLTLTGLSGSFSPGEVLIQPPANPAEFTVLEFLQLVTATENGRFYISKLGTPTFIDRPNILIDVTPDYEFTDQNRDTNPTDVGTLDGTLELTIDDKFVYQAAKVTREGGYPQTFSNVTTPKRTYEKSGLLFPDDLAALNRAQWIVYRYETATPRTDSWESDMAVELLDLEIGNRIRHSLDFGGNGSSVVLDQNIEQIEHKITPERWIIAFNGVPVDDSDYFLWGSTDPTVDEEHGWQTSSTVGGVWG